AFPSLSCLQSAPSTERQQNQGSELVLLSLEAIPGCEYNNSLNFTGFCCLSTAVRVGITTNLLFSA
ncbi:MAG: hypothetical protein UHN88_01550, partial [Eubacterium sp.]|nr:hypothetical protein [Eubacterium sp.]